MESAEANPDRAEAVGRSLVADPFSGGDILLWSRSLSRDILKNARRRDFCMARWQISRNPRVTSAIRPAKEISRRCGARDIQVSIGPLARVRSEHVLG